MEKRVSKKGRPAPAAVTATGERCSSCDQPTFNVCQHCSGLTFHNGAVAYCPPRRRTDQPVVVVPKTKEGKPPQGAVGNSGTTFRTMLRRGGKMMEQLSKNVVSATDTLFGVDEMQEEEDIDKVVEEFKKTQLEDQEKHNKF